MKVAVENQGIGLITSIIVYFIKEIFGITGGWLISLFALFLSILFVFNISIQDLIFAIKNKSTNPKNSNANFKDMLKNLKESALDIITDEVDDTTMVEEKTGFFKKLMKDKDKKQNQQEFVPNEDNEDYNEYDDEKTVKIVGFNQADDDVLEILEGTQTVDYTQDDLKELNDLMRGKNNTQSTLEETNDYSDTLFNTNVNTKNNSDLEQLQFNLPSDKKQENISNGSSNYKKPSINCLKNYNGSKNSYKEQNKSKEVIDTLKNFNIEIQDCNATFGPTITRYEVSPKPGTKVSKIVNLSDDLALSLAARSIRIEAPVPGKSVIGIEVPNDKPQVVGLREVITSNEFINDPSSLAVGLGKEISGKPLIADLAKMPHLLIAGATGSGKSVCVNTIITSLLYKSSPEEVKLLLIDPKVVELAHYNGIPHLLSPVITDGDLANKALKVIVEMMDRRYDLFGELGVRNITAYNEYVKNHENDHLKVLPRIVIIIDELADLMLVAAKEVEASIQRITQLARAAGIHLIVATQRPSVDVITGVIKANIPSRIAFAVSQAVDSRTILDQAGAERLLGNGDMLYLPNGETSPRRIQGVFIKDEEVNNICAFVKSQARPKYDDAFIQLKDLQNQGNEAGNVTADPLYEEVKRFVIASRKASTSLIQRKFSVGYSRAARLMDVLEANGIIGPARGSKPREILVQNTLEDGVDSI